MNVFAALKVSQFYFYFISIDVVMRYIDMAEDLLKAINSTRVLERMTSNDSVLVDRLHHISYML